MRTPIILLVLAALIVAIVVAVSPRARVTFNEAGTEVPAIDVVSAQQRQAPTAKRAAR
jgi:hypothetical protein